MLASSITSYLRSLDFQNILYLEENSPLLCSTNLYGLLILPVRILLLSLLHWSPMLLETPLYPRLSFSTSKVFRSPIMPSSYHYECSLWFLRDAHCMVACQRPSQFGSLGTWSSLSSEKSWKMLKPYIYISNLLPGVRIHKQRLKRKMLCCRNTIHNFKTMISCGGRRPSKERQLINELPPGMSVQRLTCRAHNSTKGHLTRDRTGTFQVRMCQGENVLK